MKTVEEIKQAVGHEGYVTLLGATSRLITNFGLPQVIEDVQWQSTVKMIKASLPENLQPFYVDMIALAIKGKLTQSP